MYFVPLIIFFVFFVLILQVKGKSRFKQIMIFSVQIWRSKDNKVKLRKADKLNGFIGFFSENLVR